jgi:hypothetical protein
MKKVLLYNDKVFFNARSFYEFILINVFDGDEPGNWSLEYVAVCFTNKLKTISGIKVDWVTVELKAWDDLRASNDGWIKWTSGGDKTFVEFVQSRNESFTKEHLWRWVIDYVVTYDLPRSKMRRLVEDVIEQSRVVGKLRGVNLYKVNIRKV